MGTRFCTNMLYMTQSQGALRTTAQPKGLTLNILCLIDLLFPLPDALAHKTKLH